MHLSSSGIINRKEAGLFFLTKTNSLTKLQTTRRKGSRSKDPHKGIPAPRLGKKTNSIARVATQKDRESLLGISEGTGGHRWKEYELERMGVWVPNFRTHPSFAMWGNLISCQIHLVGNPEPLRGEKAVPEIPNLTKNWEDGPVGSPFVYLSFLWSTGTRCILNLDSLYQMDQFICS